MDALHALLTRRSTSVKDMVSPAPTQDELEQILTAATRVPDHGKLCPWRLVILREPGARKLGEISAAIFAQNNADSNDAQIAAEAQRFLRAPLCIAVISTTILGTKPVWEQELSAGAVCCNLLHAANALNYGAKWLTEWVAYDAQILSALGGKSGDKIAGFIYLGTKAVETPDRERPNLKEVVREFR